MHVNNYLRWRKTVWKIKYIIFKHVFFEIGVLNGTGSRSRSLHSPPLAFDEIEKRVTAPIAYSQSQHRHDIPSLIQSEPAASNASIPDGVADLAARPISASQNIEKFYKTLPPIHSHRQQKQRRNKYVTSSNKSGQLLEPQRRIVRFIKYMKWIKTNELYQILFWLNVCVCLSYDLITWYFLSFSSSCTHMNAQYDFFSFLWWLSVSDKITPNFWIIYENQVCLFAFKIFFIGTTCLLTEKCILNDLISFYYQ
jgi:hypothetical protein